LQERLSFATAARVAIKARCDKVGRLVVQPVVVEVVNDEKPLARTGPFKMAPAPMTFVRPRPDRVVKHNAMFFYGVLGATSPKWMIGPFDDPIAVHVDVSGTTRSNQGLRGARIAGKTQPAVMHDAEPTGIPSTNAFLDVAHE
jgi:hypothetical protein